MALINSTLHEAPLSTPRYRGHAPQRGGLGATSGPMLGKHANDRGIQTRQRIGNNLGVEGVVTRNKSGAATLCGSEGKQSLRCRGDTTNPKATVWVSRGGSPRRNEARVHGCTPLRPMACALGIDPPVGSCIPICIGIKPNAGLSYQLPCDCSREEGKRIGKTNIIMK